jgi:hypothetical protein
MIYMHPFPPVRIWFVRQTGTYWQTSTDKQRYGAGFASRGGFETCQLTNTAPDVPKRTLGSLRLP